MVQLRVLVAMVGVAAVVVLSGCGGSSEGASTTTTSEPELENPPWATGQLFDRLANGDLVALPSTAALNFVCLGKGLPADLGRRAATGSRSVAFYWKQSGRDGQTDIVRGGGVVPGPVLMGTEDQPEKLEQLAHQHAVGWVACISRTAHGPTRHCRFQDGLASTVYDVEYFPTATWTVDVREAATGKSIKVAQLSTSAPDDCPKRFNYRSSTFPTNVGSEPTQAQIADIAHAVLG